jgi:hypothetical protein
MTVLLERHNDNDIVEPVLSKQKWSLDQLEAALRRRIGWMDEAISPFARRREQDRQTPDAGSTGA